MTWRAIWDLLPEFLFQRFSKLPERSEGNLKTFETKTRAINPKLPEQVMRFLINRMEGVRQNIWSNNTLNFVHNSTTIF